MPIYTYRCESCGIQFDYRQSFSAANLTICPECEEKSLHRVYRPVGVVFKGSGFYATDNRSPSGQKSERSHRDEEAKSENKTESKTADKKSSEPAKKAIPKKSD